ncbi:MAG: helix-turn-helix transcriptional regulator [Candidatus Omnitrophica bacterium]|nr:helix-turn-helix transcriptional regulator [Candidatus Omnitrophota bacterium]
MFISAAFAGPSRRSATSTNTASPVRKAQQIRESGRKRRGLAQEERAEKAGVDYKYLQKIEGKNPPNIKIETIEKLAKIFKIPPAKLLD